jgi:hypothetical protein
MKNNDAKGTQTTIQIAVIIAPTSVVVAVCDYLLTRRHLQGLLYYYCYYYYYFANMSKQITFRKTDRTKLGTSFISVPYMDK